MQVTQADIRLSLTVTILIIVLSWVMFADTWPIDLSAIYFAALSYGTDQRDLIYLAQPAFFGSSASLEWGAMATDLGHPGEIVLPYLYAPIWAAILAPIATSVSPMAFYKGALIVHGVLCSASIYLAWRIARPAQISLRIWMAVSLGLVVLTIPFFHGFLLNQPQFVVTFLILLAFERYRAGALVAAGVILGIAAAIKVTPAVFVVIFLMDRNWKAVAVTVATGLGLLVVSVAVTGVELNIAFWGQLQHAASKTVITAYNFGLEGVVVVLTDTPTAAELSIGFALLEASPWVGPLAKLILLGFAAALWWITRHAPLAAATMGRLLALWSALIFLGPLGWSHYVIGPLFLLPALLGVMPVRSGVIWITVIVLALSTVLNQFLQANAASFAIFILPGAATLVCLACLGVWVARKQAVKG